MQIQTKLISELLPADYNPRKDLQPGDPEYERLKKSILEYDYIDPIIWNQRTGRVVGGHQRLKILIELGKEEIDVSVVDFSEEKEKALNISLNKNSGDWDLAKLKDILLELDTGDFDIEITGFDEQEIEKLLAQFHVDLQEIQEDEFDPEAEAEKIQEPISKPGHIWQLGRHRLMCGDATNKEEVQQLMNGQLADMVFTDPPYNVDYTGKTKDALTIKNDSMDGNRFKTFLFDAFSNMYEVTKPGGAIYICHADTEGVNFRTALIEAGWMLKQCLVWVKQQFVMGRQDYHWRHEPILYGWKPGASHCWYGSRNQDTVWEIDRPMANREHPTMKPLALIGKAICNNLKGMDLVLDLFGGSGSTLIASEQLDRVCYMMELDPVYCDVIINRYKQATGYEPVLLMQAK